MAEKKEEDPYEKIAKQYKAAISGKLHGAKDDKGKQTGNFGVDFSNLGSASIDDVLNIQEYLLKNEKVSQVERASVKLFDKGLQGLVEKFFSEKFEAGNLSSIGNESDRKAKVGEFVKQLMEYSLKHYQGVLGYKTFDTDFIKDPNKDLDNFNKLLRDMFGNLFQQGEPVTWQSVIEHFDKILSDKDVDISTVFGLKDPDDRASAELYKALFSSVRGYATRHLQPYRSAVIQYLATTQDQDKVEAIKNRAAKVLKRYSSKFEDVEPLELLVKDPSLTSHDATLLLNNLYREGVQAALPYDKYIKQGKSGIKSHVVKYAQPA